MSTKKERSGVANSKANKQKKKEKDQSKTNRAHQLIHFGSQKEANMKGIKNILKIQQDEPVVLSKKSSKKLMYTEQYETQEVESEMMGRQKIEKLDTNRSIKKLSKKIEVKHKPEIKVEENKMSGRQMPKEKKEQTQYESSHMNYSGMKSQSQRSQHQKEETQTLDKFDFIEIDGLSLTSKSEVMFRVLLQNKETQQQSHSNWKKRQLIPVCRGKKRNLIYDYYVKLLTASAMNKDT